MWTIYSLTISTKSILSYNDKFQFIKNIAALISKRLPLHKGAFFVHLCLVNFPNKHCICGQKCKNTAYHFKICRIFEKMSFRVQPYFFYLFDSTIFLKQSNIDLLTGSFGIFSGCHWTLMIGYLVETYASLYPSGDFATSIKPGARFLQTWWW